MVNFQYINLHIAKQRVLGASLNTDAWSYINVKWSSSITVGIKMADADRGV